MSTNTAQYFHEYYMKNKEYLIKQQMLKRMSNITMCTCGKTVAAYNMQRHLKTKMHHTRTALNLEYK